MAPAAVAKKATQNGTMAANASASASRTGQNSNNNNNPTTPDTSAVEPNDELGKLQFKSNKMTDDSLESTRRILALCDESKEAGFKTLMCLDEQGEAMDKIEEDLDKINADMRQAESNLKGMEKICGICVCPCRQNREFKEDDKTWTPNDDGKIVSGQPARVVDDRQAGGPTTSQFVARITRDAREDEMENNMESVGNMIGNLKNMAIDMGSEIVNQNGQLDRINQKANSNEIRVSAANQRASKLMHSA